MVRSALLVMIFTILLIFSLVREGARLKLTSGDTATVLRILSAMEVFLFASSTVLIICNGGFHHFYLH